MNKKFKKLLRSPRLFFKDMLINQSARAPARPQAFKYKAKHQYSIVSAVYNVGRYLDKYFESLVRQHLDFEEGIEIILVDDGSTDDSKEIILRWQALYPKNIVYIHKENGGQASARNLGLRHATRPWVTFVDPDDFLDLAYFCELDKFLSKYRAESLQLVASNLVFYFDDSGQFKDTHPLKYKYAKGDKILPHDRLDKHIHLAVHSALFRTDLIQKYGLSFDERVRPVFEDGLFVSHYLSVLQGGSIGFAPKSTYYYRKREDGSSTLDTAWTHPGRLSAVLQYGHLGSFSAHKAAGHPVPVHIQRMSLYDIVWVIRHFLSNDHRHAFLGETERVAALELLKKIFGDIEARTIMDYELAGCWFMQKVGMLGTFKGLNPDFQIVYVDDVDAVKHQVHLRYFTSASHPPCRVEIGGQEIPPTHAKTLKHRFLGEEFVQEHLLWVSVPEDATMLQVYLGNEKVRLGLAGKQHPAGLKASDIYRHFHSKTTPRSPNGVYRNAWILIDRDTDADDNAEHLYRHLKLNHPQINAFFALRRESADWDRLQSEGFRLLPFDTPEYRTALHGASKVISSHADAYITDYLGADQRRSAHYVFLQHGVTHNNLSAWLNTKKIDCLITSAEAEQVAITRDGGPYRLTERSVVLTGFPRHDALLSTPRSSDDSILIMPTWRSHLVRKAQGPGASRELVPNIMESDYIRNWAQVLKSPRLKALAQATGKRVVFMFPHANLQGCLPQLQLPDYIEVRTRVGTSMQDLFRSASLMITDFSSVAFEMAYLERPVVYFQFDEDAFYNGGHVWTRDYFDYRSHGFGPVVGTAEETLDAAAAMLDGARPERAHYITRATRFFAYRDGQCCERVVEAIRRLDVPDADVGATVSTWRHLAGEAMHAGHWRWAMSRYAALCAAGGRLAASELQDYLVAVLASLGADASPDLQATTKLAWIDAALAVPHMEECEAYDAVVVLRLSLAEEVGDWQHVLEHWWALLQRHPDAEFHVARILRSQGSPDRALDILSAPGVRSPQTQIEWQLLADLAALMQRWDLADRCTRSMVAMYPESAPRGALLRMMAMESMLSNVSHPGRPEADPTFKEAARTAESAQMMDRFHLLSCQDAEAS